MDPREGGKDADHEELLGSHPFFTGLGADAMELIAGCASNVHFAEGDYIFDEGRTCQPAST